ncbi:MAG TPA: SWIM zinc finger family protein [Ilumatobacter sp.]|nr:SWIM zinc finger family protein [Ilumatobacter sp.]
MEQRWSVEQVAAVAPNAAAVASAEPLAVPRRWASTGCDARAVWGKCLGSGAEPYDTMVDHSLADGTGAAWRCSCPSRRRPCKHALALLLLWVRGGVPEAAPPPAVVAWITGRTPHQVVEPVETTDTTETGDDSPPAPPPPTDRGDLDRARDERVARMRAGLTELDRWLADRMRTGLADPALARYSTWDALAARLVDAQAGALANRVRRLAGLVGASPGWHADVLAELGLLHLLAQAGLRLGELPDGLADRAATAVGWQVRHADVLAGVPDTDDWFVAGRSDVREDRIEVRRVWLRGVATGEWAMVLSFAAYQQSLDDSFTVGAVVRADFHRYPGRSLRVLVSRTKVVEPVETTDTPKVVEPVETTETIAAEVATTVAGACDAIGRAVAAEPWLERYPAIIRATPTFADGRWVLTDATGSLALAGEVDGRATLLAASAGAPVAITVEWTPRGVVPLAVHLADRTLDIGPRADPSFVGAA